MKKLRCLGKCKNGERCNNKFLFSGHSNIFTCNLHRDQKIEFVSSKLEAPCKMRDVADLIAKEIKDAKTFNAFAKVCRSTAKACHKLQLSKKKEFAVWLSTNSMPEFYQRFANIRTDKTEFGWYQFPNGMRTLLGKRNDKLFENLDMFYI